ncbi:MAG: FKBP-type peptidyl-prolyl cis-trans isomerase [Candidatus Sumerlaeaceae bacterium]|nr:FKBP-type peptidyl-prolyl cis-trans isomerase [Candidatus Sumerlaeaceae bacterium]
MPRMRLNTGFLATLALVVNVACVAIGQAEVTSDSLEVTSVSPQTSVVLESGLIYQDIVKGSGREPLPGQKVGFHYVGKVISTGKIIDNSRIKIIPNPLRVTLGGGKLIKGIEEGIIGMRVGGRRLIEIPPELGYGDAGVPPEIPPKARLLFDIELVEVRDNETTGSTRQTSE